MLELIDGTICDEIRAFLLFQIKACEVNTILSRHSVIVLRIRLDTRLTDSIEYGSRRFGRDFFHRLINEREHLNVTKQEHKTFEGLDEEVDELTQNGDVEKYSAEALDEFSSLRTRQMNAGDLIYDDMLFAKLRRAREEKARLVPPPAPRNIMQRITAFVVEFLEAFVWWMQAVAYLAWLFFLACCIEGPDIMFFWPVVASLGRCIGYTSYWLQHLGSLMQQTSTSHGTTVDASSIEGRRLAWSQKWDEQMPKVKKRFWTLD
jgi:hypothetical protein